MKSLYILAVALTVGLNAWAQPAEKVKWYTLDEALKLNAKAPRKIMIDVYTDWCGWCKVMDRETFGNPTIARYINAHFYPVKFNAESTDAISFAGRKFQNQGQGAHQFAAWLLNGRMSYPSVAYLTGKLELIAAVPGFYNPEKIEPLLHFIVEEKYRDNIQLEEYEKTFVGEVKKK